MNHNEIADIRALSGLTNLTDLNLEDNIIQRTIAKNGIQEIELPQIIKAAKDSNSKIYTEEEYILTNCSLSEDGTKIIVNTDEVTEASIQIQGGKADGTKFTVSIEDTTPPEVEVKYSTTNLTNQNVTVTITANEEIQKVEGWTLSTGKTILTKVYEQNGEETVTITDIAGNETTQEIEVNNIDKIKPELEVSYNPNSLTNQNVTVTVRANEEIRELEWWSLSTDQKTLIKIYEQNTTETINITDIAGNSTAQEISINYIDKIAPKAVVKYSTLNPTNQNVIVTIEVDKEIREVEGWTLDQSKKVLTKEYEQNGEEEVTITDLAGNEITAIVNVNNIDKIPPELEIKYSTTEPTEENVIVTIIANEEIQIPDGWIEGEDKNIIYKEYDANTEEIVVIKDLAGNETEANIKIENIIKKGNNGQNDDQTSGDETLADKEYPAAGIGKILLICIGVIIITGTIGFIKNKKYKNI